MPPALKTAFAPPSAATAPTRPMRTGSLSTLHTIALMPTASPSGRAESLPDRPIKIVVPFPPGGPTDVAARLVAQILPSRLGQSLLIENISGAGGRIGTKAAASAPPDGYSLLLGCTNINVIIEAIYKNVGFD